MLPLLISIIALFVIGLILFGHATANLFRYGRYAAMLVDFWLQIAFGVLYCGLSFFIYFLMFARTNTLPLQETYLHMNTFFDVCQTLFFLCVTMLVLGINGSSIWTVMRNKGGYRAISLVMFIMSQLLFWPGLYAWFAVEIPSTAWFTSPFMWYALSCVLSVAIIVFSQDNLESS